MIPPDKVALLVQAFRDGLSYRESEVACGVSRATVETYFGRWRRHGLPAAMSREDGSCEAVKRDGVWRKSGRYWVGQTHADGDWTVFWSHPDFANWHLAVATFTDLERARSYAEVENDCLDDDLPPRADEKASPPLLLPPPTNVTPVAVRPVTCLAAGFIVEQGKRLADQLPQLFETHPDGVSSKDVMRLLGFKYQEAVGAIRWVEASGYAKWLNTGIRGNKMLYPPDAPVRAPELGTAQRSLLEVLANRADGRGMAEVSYRDLSGLSGIALGSVAMTLSALETKGFVMLAKPGKKGGPNTYQVLKRPA